MENKPQLLKIGESIVFAQHGVDYQMEPNKVYTVDYDRYAEQIKLKEAPNLQLPSNLYITKEDEKFMKRVLNNFSKSEKSTGVMLAGTKGTGKTVMAKQLALTSNLPIILIDKSLRPCYLKTLFNKLSTLSVCVIFVIIYSIFIDRPYYPYCFVRTLISDKKINEFFFYRI